MIKIKNRIKAKSLKWQLLLSFFLILLFLLIIMEATQYITMKRYLYESKEQFLVSRFHNLKGDILGQIRTSEDVKKYAATIIEKTIYVNSSTVVVDASGNIVESSGMYERKFPATPVPRLSQEEYKNIINKKGHLEGYYALVKDENNDLQLVTWSKIEKADSTIALIQLSTSMKNEHEILEHQLYTYMAVSALILIIGGVFCITAIKRTLKPLYSMTDTVEKINVEKLNVRLSEDNGQFEVDRLTKAFNSMLKRIESSFEKEQAAKAKMRKFVSDASHELRTPLTSIHGFVEVLLRGAAKNEKQLDMALNSILKESDRLTKLVNELLMLTRMDQNVDIQMDIENINHIIEELYPQLKILGGERKIELQLKKDILVYANGNQLKQVILNLVQNAVQHTDEREGIITISTSLTEKFSGNPALLKVSDNGSGIPKEHIDEIFDRFFRSETDRSRRHGGYGLGLSIVKSIVDAHGGKIEVASEIGKGTAFYIYLRMGKKITSI